MQSLAEFRIIERLYASSKTLVYRAVRIRDDFPVIIKTPKSDFPSQQDINTLSLNYELSNLCNHKTLPRPIEFANIGDKHYLVYADQHVIDLRKYLLSTPKHRVSIKNFFVIALQIVEAIAEIHHHNIIFKDLHPSNILIDPETLDIFITDFGLASQLTREQPSLRPPPFIEGVLNFISPEQTGRMNRSLDYRTDFYSLGCCFYQMLTGVLPFAGSDAIEIVHAHIAKTQISMSAIRPKIPLALEKIVNKLLSKTAEERYQSALGLKYDLKQCQSFWLKRQSVPDFRLASKDFSEKFHIPQKLYGRETEEKQLLNAYLSASGGHVEMFSISGHPGVGKSALVHEIHKPIAQHGGLFIAGKFSQYKQNSPYSALIEAFKQWVQHILSSSEEQLHEVRQEIQAKLGNNSRLLVDFIPEMAPLLGAQKPVSTLPPNESLNRFHLVFQQFLVVITKNTPLVIFIDDLQWADLGTLNLLPKLMEIQTAKILLIVCYRDNELHTSHPTSICMESVRKLSYFTEVELAAINEEQMLALVTDSVRQTGSHVKELSHLVYQKTRGNAFFTQEFLKKLYYDRLINLSPVTGQWYWDIQRINEQNITDNVVEFLLEALNLLPLETLVLLQYGACIGNTFDLNSIFQVVQNEDTKLERDNIEKTLWIAVQQGIITEDTKSNETTNKHYQFTHDRMFQATYSSLSDHSRKELHLKIARALTPPILPKMPSKMVIALTSQYNACQALVTNEEEKLKISKLNLESANIAQAHGVWNSSVEYAKTGIINLPEDRWNTQYQLTLELNKTLLLSSLLAGQFDNLASHSEEILSHTKSNTEKAETCYFLSVYCMASQHRIFGFQKAIEGLGFLNIVIPESLNNLSEGIDRLRQSIEPLDEQIFKNLTPAVKESHKIALKILYQLALMSFIGGNHNQYTYFTLKSLKHLLMYGLGGNTASIYAFYAVYMAGMKQYKRSALFETLALEFLKSSETMLPENAAIEVGAAYNALGAATYTFTHTLDESIDFMAKGYHLAFENGEVTIGLGILGNMTMLKYARGIPLPLVEAHLRQLQSLLDSYNQKVSAGRLYQRLITLFQNKGSEALLFETSFQPQEWIIVSSTGMLGILFNLRYQYYFWSDQPNQLKNTGLAIEKNYGIGSNFIPSIDYQLLKAINHCRHKNQDLDYSLESALEYFHELTAIKPANFEHKYLLLKAEILVSRQADLFEIVQTFLQAIKSAASDGFIQYQAYANERLGQMWLEHDFTEYALKHLNSAYYLYKQWGCEIKLPKLERIIAATQQKLHVKNNTIYARNSIETSWHTTKISSLNALDLTSIIKSTSAIAQRSLKPDNLFDQLLNLTLENSGAQNGTLFFTVENRLKIVSYISNDVQSRDADPQFPQTIINYTKRSASTLIIQNLEESTQWQDDPYFSQRAPRSILCCPIYFRNMVQGVLYLENTLTPYAFTEDRLKVISVFMSQAAISLENHLFSSELQKMNSELAATVEVRTDALQSTNRELASFGYSVSHDLRSPLRTISGFTSALFEDYADQLSPEAKNYLDRVLKGSLRMNELIEGLSTLYQYSYNELNFEYFDLSSLVEGIVKEMEQHFPNHSVEFSKSALGEVYGDKILIRAALENLLMNAWKYTSKTANPKVEIDYTEGSPPTYAIKDNGAGFDMNHADMLFVSFQRLHSDEDFAGTGIGLATVKRIIDRHHGKIWAEAKPNKGATFFFTLSKKADSLV